MTTQTDIKNARRFLGIEDLDRVLKEIRSGVPMGVAFGNAAGLGQMSSASSDIEEDTSTAPNTQEEIAKLKKPLDIGDQVEDLQLKDCETGEPVTLDGIGGNGKQAVTPIGFENCEAAKKPTMADLEGKTIFRTTYFTIYSDPNFENVTVYSLSSAEFYSFVSTGTAWAQSESTGGCPPQIGYVSDTGTSGSWTGRPGAYFIPGSGNPYCGFKSADRQAAYNTSTSTEYKQAYIDNFVAPVWPENDKNHLSYSSEKSCFEPLCHDLNPYVSEKYQGCEDERILCDEDGNKVHVKANGDGSISVTQEKYGRTATIRNGRVDSVNILTKAQSDRIFA